MTTIPSRHDARLADMRRRAAAIAAAGGLEAAIDAGAVPAHIDTTV